MNALPFIKMHGLGNDFVVLDARAAPIALRHEEIRRIGDRHRGVGFDQLVLIEAADDVDARLRFFNADGSASGACGNGTRCVARLIAEDAGRPEVSLRTDAGTLSARLLDDGRVRVAMGEPRLDWRDIPVVESCDTLELPLDHDDLPRPVGVSMGNPHAVFLVEDVDLVERHGAVLERHPFFPERANIGFARVFSRDRMRLRVHERGAGLTLACGSGACAAMVAARRRGLVGDRATLILDGGELDLEWPGHGPVVMTGPVATAFRGEIDRRSLLESA
ncbi:MAG: diaminopimelate epimerase [Geminicoccaceae bacterium]|nr:diaminopimelate epimerase [Geminicoccaceae bacterium]